MEVKFERKFLSQLSKVDSKKLQEEVKKAIGDVEKAPTVLDIPRIKRLTGYKHAYRIRLGDYRIGLVIEKNAVSFVCFMHRPEIYKYFP